MKLNRAERLLVNNPVRALIQRHYEGRLLVKLGGRLDGAHVLETGCGQGAGVEVLLRQFGVRRVCAIDLDPVQLKRAYRRLAGYPRESVVLAACSVEELPFPDGCFDGVFDFGLLHHVQNWQGAVSEIRRVITPSGRFYFEEVTAAALNRWLYRTFLDHPVENRFSEADFVRELARRGFNLVCAPHHVLGNDIFIGVGELRL